jgi:integrase/recombinase XerD
MEQTLDHDLIQEFLKDCRLRQMSTHTIESYGSTMNLFSRFLKPKKTSLTDINRDILRDYVDYLIKNKIQYKTMQNRFSTFITFYDYLVYENKIEKNIIRDFQKHYLRKYKKDDSQPRRLISVEEMAQFINLIPDIRDKAMVLLFAKTGIRRRELSRIDLDEINWKKMSIRLKPTKKRSNCIVYFDYETAIVLKKWIDKRENHTVPSNKALFVSYIDKKKRLHRNGIGYVFVKWAIVAGLHNQNTKNEQERFTPHCCRHWFTTHLRRAGMQREFIEELRGDKRTSSMDIYYHIDHDELRRAYLSCIPQLGIA